MANPTTSYAEIQQDEIEVLRSIYMEDFVETETKTGAWNKIINRAFQISLRNGKDADISFLLLVSLPNTYPKTLPSLKLKFGPAVSPKVQLEAHHLVDQKPRTLLGSEMIFEIATALQDLLDNISGIARGLSLDEERTTELLKAQELEQDDKINPRKPYVVAAEHLPNAHRAEEDQSLSVLSEQAKSRSERRRAKSSIKLDAAEVEANEGLKFDHVVVAKDAEGSPMKFEVVHHRVQYRRGPVTRVSKVHVWNSPKHLEPSLVLKECRFPTCGTEDILKEQIYYLDRRLDQMVQLPANLNIIKPLSFTIRRGEKDDLDPGHWYIAILMELAPQGSMQDLLETVHTIDVEPVRAWTLQLLEGLMFLHRHGVVHACLHLRNILLVKAETGNTVAKLADASYQHTMHVLKNGLNADYSAARSTSWIPPEVMQGSEGKRIAASDIWDLGTTLIQMLFGLKVQSVHPSPRDLTNNVELSQSFRDLLDRMFKSDHRRRPSAFELLPSTFLRSNDGLLSQPTLSRPYKENYEPLHTTIKIARRRRESTKTPSTSRYRTDFVEAGRLGRGGYGEVFRARNKLDGRFYAIKMIQSSSASTLNDVLSEILLLSQLNHPNVVRYFNAWLESEDSSPNGRHESQSSDDSSNSNDAVGDELYENGRSGLDFMSESGPNIVFERDSDDEAPKPRITPEHGTTTILAAAVGNKATTKNESDGEVDEELNDEQAPIADYRLSVERNCRGTPLSTSTLYIQMEYCERKTLRDLIDGGIHAEYSECWRVFRQIVEGLTHIHAAYIVHRDLKPENIFIDASGDVRIGDFGLARPGDYQGSFRVRIVGEAYTSFTKSVGTAFYVAPEVRSAGMGKYNEKADMYSLGIILFEMCTPIMTGMERVETIGKLRDKKPTLPLIFKGPEMAIQADTILSLVNHDASTRPSSSELLTSGKIPEEIEGDRWARHIFRHAHQESYRKRFLASMFPQPEETQVDFAITNEAKVGVNQHVEDDEEFYSKALSSELEYDNKDSLNVEPGYAILRNFIEEKMITIFRRHGATKLEMPVLVPFSSQYSKKLDQTVKLVDPSGHLLQLPYDFTLPYASFLAKSTAAPRKTYTIGNVFRASRFDGPPRRLGEAHFDIISSNYLDLALREAEAIKVLDEIVSLFPSMSSLQMCYHINHSRILNAILSFCNIHRSRWAVVKETLAALHAGQMDWTRIRGALRSPAVGVAATSLEELMRFNFRDVCDKAISKLRSLLRKTDHLEAYFGHLEAITLYLKRFNINRKIYVNPLGSVNESFYRGNLFFQCIFDTPKREVFAAGGRYDRLIESYKVEESSRKTQDTIHAVGFNFNWDRLSSSMARFLKADTKSKAGRKTHVGTPEISLPQRCDVLLGSSDREILYSTGLELIQELWANDISAELAVDTNTQGLELIHSATNESRDAHPWSIYIKQDGYIKVRSALRREETDMRNSDLFAWLRNEIRERDRVEGRSPIAHLYRHSSQQEAGRATDSGEPDVKVITSKTRGKKFNRKTVIEEAISITRDTVNSFLDGPILAIETKEDYFEALRNTRLAEPESWRKFIQHAPAEERAYLRDVQRLLQDLLKESGARNAFIYNFRSKACIYYDLGRVL